MLQIPGFVLVVECDTARDLLECTTRLIVIVRSHKTYVEHTSNIPADLLDICVVASILEQLARRMYIVMTLVPVCPVPRQLLP
jgi:hypothetical protein